MFWTWATFLLATQKANSDLKISDSLFFPRGEPNSLIQLLLSVHGIVTHLPWLVGLVDLDLVVTKLTPEILLALKVVKINPKKYYGLEGHNLWQTRYKTNLY